MIIYILPPPRHPLGFLSYAWAIPRGESVGARPAWCSPPDPLLSRAPTSPSIFFPLFFLSCIYIIFLFFFFSSFYSLPSRWVSLWAARAAKRVSRRRGKENCLDVRLLHPRWSWCAHADRDDALRPRGTLPLSLLSRARKKCTPPAAYHKICLLCRSRPLAAWRRRARCGDARECIKPRMLVRAKSCRDGRAGRAWGSRLVDAQLKKNCEFDVHD